MFRVLLATALFLPLFSHGQVYKTTDEEGNVVFTDAPPADASNTQAVDLQPTNTAAAPASTPPPSKARADKEPVADYSVAITAPANETTIPMGPGNFSVSASVTPGLSKGAQLQLMLAGAPYGDPQSGTGWALTNVPRGSHDVSVSVLDAQGNPVASSSSVRVYVLRPSVNFRNR